MFNDGWVCRACWKPNRPQDDRCYRCKTPRDAQLTVEAGSQKEAIKPGAHLQGRMDTQLPLVAALVAWPMWLSGVLGIIGAALIFLLALLSAGRVDESGTSVGLVLGITAAVVAVVSALWIFISRSVRRHARWAYAIAAIAYLLPTAPTVLGLVEVPQQVDLPSWYRGVSTFFTLLYVLLGICAAFLLGASFMRSDEGPTETTPEAGG